MSNYILNLTELELKNAVRFIENSLVYFSIGSHNNVLVLTEKNLPYAIMNDAKYYVSYGLQESQD